MSESPKSITLIELFMEIGSYLVPITGIGIVAFTLDIMTTLPKWGCALVAIPAGAVAGWGMLVAATVAANAMYNRFAERVTRYKRDQKERDEKGQAQL